jgi:hypothetical protein
LLENKKVEFKYNAKNISDCPQWVSPMNPSQYLNNNYEEFYYNNYLPEIYQGLDITIPEKSVYLLEINKPEPPCMKLIQEKYYKGCKQSSRYTDDKIDIDFYLKCKLISKNSIIDFISNTRLNMDKLNNYLWDSQKDKYYMLYKNDQFYLEKPNRDDYNIIYNEPIPHKYSFQCITQSNKKMNILLRWKNGNGIAFPAFQIK